jgi:hypothetical protein
MSDVQTAHNVDETALVLNQVLGLFGVGLLG